MNVHFRKTFLIAGFLAPILIFSFQNCGQNGFSALPGDAVGASLTETNLNSEDPLFPDEVSLEKSAWQCRFHLKGSNGKEWQVIRYNEDSDCNMEESIVRSQNPQAAIMNITSVFVNDPMANISHWSCHFKLSGRLGNTWTVLRNVQDQKQCLSEISEVLANNPNATIIAQSRSYVNIRSSSSSKWMCQYSLSGKEGSNWTSERESLDSTTCDAETALVRQNNPQASITSVVGPYFVKF